MSPLAPLSRRRRILGWTWPVLLTAALVLAIWPRPVPTAYDLDGLGRVPVSAEGRIKPLDTVARTSLMILSGRQSLVVDGQQQGAMRFLVDLVAAPDRARDYPLFRIDHPNVLSLIGRSAADGKRHSLATIVPHLPALREQARQAAEVPPRARDAYQRAVLTLLARVDLVASLGRLEAPYVIPPLAPGEEWRPFATALAESGHGGGPPDPAVDAIGAIMSAYHQGQPDRFNEAVSAYLARLDGALPAETRSARVEIAFNRVQPFLVAAVLYLIAFLVGCGALLVRARGRGDGDGDGLRRAAIRLVVIGLILHSAGLLTRMWLQGRPPVTNLYSSAILTGWGCVVFGLAFERRYPLGLAVLKAALIGFVTLVVAHNLGNDGDTLEMMQAVLDTNVWLATHVVAVTLGYSATFFAGGLGALAIVIGATRRPADAASRALARMVTGILGFALFFSFTGTVLGGIWADQSWGRFWGWDPKDNGAVLVVLMNALILHARWGGLIGLRGLMTLAVGGNIVTAWSWFGTNLLGVGLHAYGFMDSGAFWLIAFVLSQMAIIAVGLLRGRGGDDDRKVVVDRD